MIKYSDEVVSTYGNVKRVGDVADFTIGNYIGWTIEGLQYALNMDSGKVTFSSKEERDHFLNTLLQLTHVESMNRSFQKKQGVLVTRYWTDVCKIGRRKEGFFRFKDEEGYRFLTYFGDDAFSQVFDCATDFSDGFARVSKAGQEYFINTTGQKVFACDPNFCYGNFHNGLAYIVDKNQKIGYMNGVGQVVIPCIYSRATDFSDGFARVSKAGQEYFIDTTGHKVFDCDPDMQYGNFHNGLAYIADKNNKYGYVDKSGQVIIPCVYDYALDFSDGLVHVWQGEQEYFIDTTGQKVFDCVPDLKYSYFRDGLARVENKENEKYGYIDKKGHLVIDCVYTDASHFGDGMAIVIRDQHKFAMDKQENLLTTTSVLTSIEDVSRLPKNTFILDSTEVAVLSFENGDVWFRTTEERDAFIKMLDVDQEYTLKRVLD